MYDTALEGFTKLKDDETFGPIVPFYIAQILYLNKDYDGILEIAPDLLKSAPRNVPIEMYRFIEMLITTREIIRKHYHISNSIMPERKPAEGKINTSSATVITRQGRQTRL